MVTAAEIVANRLYEAGCRHAFGIPGGEILTLMNAIDAAGIKFVLVKHENSGGFMAEGTHHFTQSPCILLATVGPGVANAINVITNCYQDQVPLIFLTGCIDAQIAETFTHQVFDQRELLRPITKANFTAVDGAIDVIIDKAISISMDGRPGPVHIDIPISVSMKKQEAFTKVRRVKPAQMTPNLSKELVTARKLFKKATRPIVLAGIDVLHHNSAPTINKIINKFNLPLITTYKAKGIVPEDNLNTIGAAGLSPRADKILQALIKKSDLIILVGYDPIEMRSSWVSPWESKQKVIEFVAIENTHYVHQADISFIGHVGAGLSSLIKGNAPKKIWGNLHPAKTRQAHKTAFSPHGKWGPEAIVKGARSALPRNGVATVDTGAHRILLSQSWECYQPRGLLQSNGLCTMGVAVPIAIGRKIAEPSRSVIAFSGDAGLEMILGELATLRDLKLAIPIITFVDKELSLIKMKQKESNFKNLGVEFGETDFVKLAQAMGGWGVFAKSENEVATQVKAALLRDTFTIIVCHIGQNAYDGKI